MTSRAIAQETPLLDLIASMAVTSIAIVCAVCLLGLCIKIAADIIMPIKQGGKQ